MAAVVNVTAPNLEKAAAVVAQHIETAAKPAAAAAPTPHPAASPVDAAAHSAAGAIRTKMATMSGELAPKGPQMQQTGATAAASLAAQDAANANKLPSVPSPPSAPSVSTPRIQALDTTFKTAPPTPPPPPDPVSKLHLPNYNPGSLSTDQTRGVYLQGEQRMRDLNDQLARQGVSAEDRAKIMFDQRNALRSWTRDLMSDRGLADQLNNTDKNLTWDQLLDKLRGRGLSGEDLWNEAINSASRSRPSVNDGLGLDPNHPPPLPPILPPSATGPPGTSPIISAPPNLPPIGQHPMPNPLPPTTFGHPPTTALPPTVLDHPPLPPWLADPSPPGFQISPTQSPPIFGWSTPDPPPLPAPMPPPAGPPITIPTPDISPQQAAGAGATLLAALAALGAFLAEGPRGLFAGGG
ncbi:hypothetical protein [Mycobacterium sp.]|uniref:hypothetical protein n=1 Tax=Mycobacterium sp. TaxID=1785 RepID=UPI003D144390